MQLSDLPSRARRAVRWQSSIASRVGTALVVFALCSLLAFPDDAGATSSGTLRAEAAHLAGEIDTLNTKLDILSEEYDQASTHLMVIRHELTNDKRSFSQAASAVSTDTAHLKSQAVNAYVNAGSESGFSAAISKDGDVLPLQETYLDVASGNIEGDISTLQNSKYALQQRGLALSSAEAQAAAAAATIESAQSDATDLQGQLSSTLAGVNGQLATAVQAQEAEQQAAANRAAAQIAAQAAVATPSPAVVAPTTASSSGAGSSALHAAETELGVPYVWAGASPGEGFDCSGLAMWAWSQAGVNLPHSAQAQYDSIEHVGMGDLQPGDLIFYADGGYIYHVVMYVGGNEVIQAQDSGTSVMYTSIPPDPYGAGRP